MNESTSQKLIYIGVILCVILGLIGAILLGWYVGSHLLPL